MHAQSDLPARTRLRSGQIGLRLRTYDVLCVAPLSARGSLMAWLDRLSRRIVLRTRRTVP